MRIHTEHIMETQMKKFFAIVLLSAPLLAAANSALACNLGQLKADIKWCLDRDGGGDIAGGAYVNDVNQLNKGWKECKQSKAAQKNFDQCTARQKLDTARAFLII